MKRLGWALLIVALIIYSIVVWGWIVEGNINFDQNTVQR